MEGKLESISEVWRSIRSCLMNASEKMGGGVTGERFDERFLQLLALPSLPKRKPPISLVKWSLPRPGWMKLNVDGSSRGNPGLAGIGGVIRDDQGVLKYAFAKHVGTGSNNYAEMLALLEGVKACHRRGYFQVQIESDSKLIVEWLRRSSCRVWYLEDYWEELLTYINLLQVEVDHVFRECNKVGDFLARMRSSDITQEWSGSEVIPSALRRLLHNDALLLPSIRIG